MDNDEEVQLNNANNRKTEGKVQVKKRTIHYYEFSSKDKSRKQAELKKMGKNKDDHENSRKNDEFDKALVTKEMTLSNIGNDIF